MTWIAVVICAVLVLTALPARAQIGGASSDTLKADILYGACNPPADAEPGLRDFAEQTCASYFRGLTDDLFLSKKFLDTKSAGCLPTESPISNTEARGDFELFFREHPESAKNSAGLVAAFGIMRAHPCSKAK